MPLHIKNSLADAIYGKFLNRRHIFGFPRFPDSDRTQKPFATLAYKCIVLRECIFSYIFISLYTYTIYVNINILSPTGSTLCCSFLTFPRRMALWQCVQNESELQIANATFGRNSLGLKVILKVKIYSKFHCILKFFDKINF